MAGSNTNDNRFFLIQLSDDDAGPEATTNIYAPIRILNTDSAPSDEEYYCLKSWLITGLRLLKFVDAIPLTFLSSTCRAASVGITLALEAWLKHRNRRDAIRGAS